jgi:hypothetical protein
MLDTIRAAHPKDPIFCITAIYSIKESTEVAYRERSVNLRVMMREAALARQRAGDKLMFVVEGLELFGEPDKALFHDPTHPNDEGNERMAQRLAPIVERALFNRPAAGPELKNSKPRRKNLEKVTWHVHAKAESLRIAGASCPFGRSASRIISHGCCG